MPCFYSARAVRRQRRGAKNRLRLLPDEFGTLSEPEGHAAAHAAPDFS
jgi:hypothetical protein